MEKGKNMRNDMIETGDTVLYKNEQGQRVQAFIKKLSKDHMLVRPSTIDFEYAGGDVFSDERYPEVKLTENMFDDISLEIWSDGRGCDNSAIGVSGCHEPWKWVWIESTQVA